VLRSARGKLPPSCERSEYPFVFSCELGTKRTGRAAWRFREIGNQRAAADKALGYVKQFERVPRQQLTGGVDIESGIVPAQFVAKFFRFHQVPQLGKPIGEPPPELVFGESDFLE